MTNKPLDKTCGSCRWCWYDNFMDKSFCDNDYSELDGEEVGIAYTCDHHEPKGDDDGN